MRTSKLANAAADYKRHVLGSPSHPPMDIKRFLPYAGLAIGAAWLPQELERSSAVLRPVHTAIIVLFIAGILSIALHRLLSGQYSVKHGDTEYNALPLEDRGRPNYPSSISQNSRSGADPWSLRRLRLACFALVLLICGRVAITWRILKDLQCSKPTVEPYVPLLLATYTFLAFHRKEPRHLDDDISSTVWQSLGQSLLRSRFRYILAALLLAWGSSLGIHASRRDSTYICTHTVPFSTSLPPLQYMGLILDSVALLLVDKVLSSEHDYSVRGRRGLEILGWAATLSSAALFVAGIIVFQVSPEDRDWIITLPEAFVSDIVKLSVLVAVSAVCAIMCIQDADTLTVSMFVLCCYTYTRIWTRGFSHTHLYPPSSTGVVVVSLLLTLSGTLYYIRIRNPSVDTLPAASRIMYMITVVILVGLFILHLVLWLVYTQTLSYHPIDLLIYGAGLQHEEYLGRCSTSTSLTEAVENYRAMYSRDPPPRFNDWYEYATKRNSAIVDAFGGIHKDLTPFWSLSPSELRRKTWDSISNPWNDAGGILIRDGNAEIAPGVPGTHRWMLDGVISIIQPFAEYLPDMDLAMNLDDECRVAVPYDRIQSMQDIGHKAGKLDQEKRNEFSRDRAAGWAPVKEEEPSGATSFREYSLHSTFSDFGTVGCPPNALARQSTFWNLPELCTRCSRPHSLGQFLSNWTLAGDICHQPDMAHLHGFYLSPASFKGTNELVPVFSQSKVHGFNDILYPSPWNYMDKAQYLPSDEHPDIAFSEKKPDLFWRGGSTEGVSPGSGTWEGMARQRAVHLAKREAPYTTVLLPDTRGGFRYRDLSPSQLSSLDLGADLNLTAIVRCGGPDCADQEAEFNPLASSVDFNEHWRYKYLLDLDGAGFSGRFLPFLQSHSLPFKAALFREWWTDRLTPWKHFVPLDLRLHALYSTLAYFKGVEGRLFGTAATMKSHEEEAKRIAEDGRDWANKVLRKEDMEIYMFRLLLEWARLTDDARDTIGYQL